MTDRTDPSPGAEGPARPTIPAALARAVVRFGPTPWMFYGGATQTFADLGDRVAVLAAGLAALGVGPGDRVGLFLGNGFDWLQIEYAVTSLGAWLVPLNTTFRERELDPIMTGSEMSTLVIGDAVLGHESGPLLESLVPELAEADPGGWRSARFPALRQVIGLGQRPWPRGVTAWPEVERLGAGGGAPSAEVAGDDVALVIYTSGTTGTPKGAMLTHRSIVEHLQVWADHLGLGPGDRSILASPFFWTFGCTMNALVPLLCGSAIVLEDSFEAGQFVHDLVAYGCTHLQGVPTHYEMALRHPDAQEADLSGIRRIQIGGSTTAEGLVARIHEKMPHAALVSSYGLTEAVICTTWTDLGAPDSDVISTVGRAAPDNEVELRDAETGRPVPPGEVGVVWVRGGNVMAGYLGNERATAETIVDGWLDTGDLATMDERGYFTIVGRRTDAYKRGGANVYPAEVEALLAEHSAVAEVAVIGVSDDLYGEVGAAFVVAAPGADLRADDIVAFCKERLANYKVPEHVRFVEALPHTPSGKVQKFVLRDGWPGPEGNGAGGAPAAASSVAKGAGQ
ncbi:MAG TPA: AMP-binding protein [Acidimicrobiales bacterium]|nr:AMP-binding protein [Acidimicrobiales bacterium]